MGSNLKYYNDPEAKKQIDILLQRAASVFASEGQDSTFKEIKEAYKEENRIIDEIAKIDPEFAKVIRPYKNM